MPQAGWGIQYALSCKDRLQMLDSRLRDVQAHLRDGDVNRDRDGKAGELLRCRSRVGLTSLSTPIGTRRIYICAIAAPLRLSEASSIGQKRNSAQLTFGF